MKKGEQRKKEERGNRKKGKKRGKWNGKKVEGRWEKVSESEKARGKIKLERRREKNYNWVN